MENIIKKLKGSGGIPLKPRVGCGSHSSETVRLLDRCLWQTPFQRWAISSPCCSGCMYVPDFEFHPAANEPVANYSTEYRFLLCHFMNLVSQNIKSHRLWSGTLLEVSKGLIMYPSFFTQTPQVEAVWTLRNDLPFLLTEWSESHVIRECLGGKRSLNYRLLEQLPVRISSIEDFLVKWLIKVPSRIPELLRFFFSSLWKRRSGWAVGSWHSSWHLPSSVLIVKARGSTVASSGCFVYEKKEPSCKPSYIPAAGLEALGPWGCLAFRL